jgi:hypothetical protein
MVFDPLKWICFAVAPAGSASATLVLQWYWPRRTRRPVPVRLRCAAAVAIFTGCMNMAAAVAGVLVQTRDPVTSLLWLSAAGTCACLALSGAGVAVLQRRRATLSLALGGLFELAFVAHWIALVPANEQLTPEARPFATFPVAIALLGAVAALALWLVARSFPLDGTLRYPAARIADAREGRPATLTGVVRPRGELLVAPLSGRPCVAWQVRVRLREMSFDERRLVDEAAQDFLLDDGTESVLVAGADCELSLPDGSSFRPKEFSREQVAEFRRRWGGRAFPDSSWPLTFFGAVLEPGSRGLVRGACRWERDPSDPATANGGVYRQAPPRRIARIVAVGERRPVVREA